MLELVAKITICLLIAAGIGFATAWALRGIALRRLNERIAKLRGEHDALAGTLSRHTSELRAHELNAARLEARVAEARGEVDASRREREALEARGKELAALDGHHRLKIEGLYRDLATRSATLEEARQRIASAEAALAERTAQVAALKASRASMTAGGTIAD